MANAITSVTLAAMSVATIASDSHPPERLDQSSYETPARPWMDIAQAERERECRDRIEQVRAAAGKPKLDRSPKNVSKPVLMYAIDQRIDDCGVIVPVADPNDLRQGPKPGRPVIIPAN